MGRIVNDGEAPDQSPPPVSRGVVVGRMRAAPPTRACCRLLLLLPVLGTLVSACGSSAAGKPLRLPINGHLQLDPARASSSNLWADSLVYAGLVKFDASMNVVPDLAVALPSISRGGRRYTFTLRSDAHFANGDPVTASDVAFSLSRAVSPAEDSPTAWKALGRIVGASSVRSGRSDRLVGVHVLGTHRLRISLVASSSTFLNDLALPVGAVLDQRSLASVKPRFAREVGAGPFMVRSMGNPIDLVANPDYYAGKPPVKDLDLFHSSSYNLYRRNKVDAWAVPVARYARASRSPRFNTTEISRAYYVVDTHIRSRHLRKALDEALDRSRLARPSIPLDPSSSIVPQVVPGYPGVSDPRVYQPGKARARLRRLPIALSAMGNLPRPVHRWLIRSWRQAGVVITSADPSARLHVISLHVALPEPQAWLRAIARAVGLRSRHFNALLNRADSIPFSDVQRQLALDARAEKYLFRRAIVIPVGVRKQGYLISSQVQGLSATPIGLEPTSENWTSVSVGS